MQKLSKHPDEGRETGRATECSSWRWDGVRVSGVLEVNAVTKKYHQSSVTGCRYISIKFKFITTHGTAPSIWCFYTQTFFTCSFGGLVLRQFSELCSSLDDCVVLSLCLTLWYSCILKVNSSLSILGGFARSCMFGGKRIAFTVGPTATSHRVFS